MNTITLSGVLSKPEPAQQNPRLASAAHEFEASLMKEFLKPLQHDSLFADGGNKDDEDTAGSADALMSYGSEAMAKSISEHGGFGIARKILEHFESTENSSHIHPKSDTMRIVKNF